MISIDIGERIRLLRKGNGLTLEQLAGKIGITGPALSQIESGKNNAARSTIVGICREFGVSETWLRFGQGEMAPNIPKRQRLMDWIADVAKDDDTARIRIIEALMTLSEQEWEILERVAKKIADRDESPSA